jgi:hypothetical protein
MAHWAEIDENNIVLRVLVGDNDSSGEGYDWIMENLGGQWIKTSYNTYLGEHKLGGTPLRKNYAGIGFYYDENRDAFIPPKPFNSWFLDEQTCNWKAPIDMPNDGNLYIWNEDMLFWELIEQKENIE